MLISHGEQLIAEAQIFDKDGNYKYSVMADNDSNPAPHEIEVVVRDKDQSVNKIIKYPFRSFTYNWPYMMDDWFSNTTDNDKLKNDGTTYGFGVDYLYMTAPYTTYYGGIIVGRSSTTPTISDYNLFSVCPNGTSTNQFDYSTTIVEEPAYSSPYYQMVIRRVLTNYSGSSITVREIGLFGSSSQWSADWYWCLARDTTDYSGSAINLSIANNQSFEVKYHLRFSTSSGFVTNYLKAFYSMVTGLEDYRLTETDGSTTGNLTSDFHVKRYYDTTAGYGDNSHGIVVGKGSATPTYTDFQLDDTIAHGSVDGRLLYGAMEYSSPVVDGSDAYFQIRRSFVNDGAVNVSVTEAGVAGYNPHNTAYVMLTHVPFSGITLQPTESMRVIFTFKVSN